MSEASEAREEADSPVRVWSEGEVALIIGDYFDMLRKELNYQDFSKAEHYRSLMPRLDRRSKGAVEYKHENISAVLVGMRLPYIDGYKPALHYQLLVAEKVSEYLEARSGLLDQMRQAPLVSPTALPDLGQESPDTVKETPPDRIFVPERSGKPWLSLKGRRIDFAERDAANRRLGEIGEEFALWYEKERLRTAGRDDLAARVRWVAHDIGDGLGFDILSFSEADGSERYVEVKATGCGKYFPFWVTDLEVRCSEDVGERFLLYRVFNAGRRPRLYILTGSLRQTCELAPTLFQATARAS